MANATKVELITEAGIVSESNPLPVTGGGGGGGGTSSDFTDPFPASGTAAGFEDGSGNMAPATLNADGGLEVHVTNGGTGGTAATFGDAFPGLGTAAGASDGTDMQPLLVDGSGNLKVNLATAVPAGTNVIGHVIADTGSVAAVTMASAAVASGAYASGSISDGAVVTIGAIADAAATVGSTGTVSAKLRTLTSQVGEIQASPTANTVLARLKSINDTTAAGNIGTLGAGTPATGIGVTPADQYSEYETVAASQTAQVLGGTGGTGDYCASLLVVPATTSPGTVILLDNATSITVFTGGSTSVSNLVPFLIPIGAYSVSGAWKVTTGANVSVLATGNFT